MSLFHRLIANPDELAGILALGPRSPSLAALRRSIRAEGIDAFEIEGLEVVGDLPNEVEPITDNVTPADFFAVFAHLPNGGVDAIGDFPTHAAALAAANALAAGTPVLHVYDHWLGAR